jgi:hypothetical protein
VRSLQLAAANGTVEAKKISETDLVPFELLESNSENANGVEMLKKIESSTKP